MPRDNHSTFHFLTALSIQPEKPLFVFLPGMDGTGKLLQLQLDNGLGNVFDIRCLAIPPNDVSTWDLLAQKVVALLRVELRQHPRRVVYLCGESFGGCLALKVALKAPDLFHRLILVNPASCFNQRPWMHMGSHVSAWLPPAFYPLSAIALLPFLAALGRIGPRERKALLAAMQSVPQHISAWRVNLLRDFEISAEELAQISQPVLSIAATADRLLPSAAESTRLVRYIPDAKQVLLPQSGHASLLETDVNLYQILQENHFLPTTAIASTAR
ncbi:alpha/beta fold hydrolase [Phormidium sp. CCY1219]|uniref:alpha/beta fold hydrolase n=1 Tax=Phormidium sp. CCY1219 TaxID=2886104 RepID=UPI002D1EEADD|nr:alpha/beta fold hydrolase [Phormidium sp. CCY1219]MEB3826362.1 alpha/beta hydrolase [Phormidium sp. CCY1219]